MKTRVFIIDGVWGKSDKELFELLDKNDIPKNELHDLGVLYRIKSRLIEPKTANTISVTIFYEL